MPLSDAQRQARYRAKMTANHPEWDVWRSMKARCNNPKHLSYDYYGAKGIRVCLRWTERGKGFKNFLMDMGDRPDRLAELDRIERTGNYTPENCRWLSQFKNRSRARGEEQYLDDHEYDYTEPTFMEVESMPL